MDNQAPLDRHVRYLTWQAKIHDIERQMGQLVCKLYDLTPEEIKVIENEGD